MSGDENGADPSYVGNDYVNTFYGDVIVAYPVPVVGNGIAQSLYCGKGALIICSEVLLSCDIRWEKTWSTYSQPANGLRELMNSNYLEQSPNPKLFLTYSNSFLQYFYDMNYKYWSIVSAFIHLRLGILS